MSGVSVIPPSERRDMPGGKKFPRTGRLLAHADFDRVYERGKRHFASHLTVFYLRRETGGGKPGEGKPGEGMRIGFTVSRALGGAVDRNRMRRRLREAVRLLRPEKTPPVDVVINPKKSLRTAEFADLLREVGRAFEVIQKPSPEKNSGVRR